LAGFLKEEIEAIWDQDENYFTVRTTEQRENLGGYIHKGIALREFQKEFVLAPNIRVARAQFESGILRVLFVGIPHESKPSKRIVID